MKANNNGTDIAHNVQMAEKSKKSLNVDKITVLADKGYRVGNCLKNCEENGINAIVSKPEESGNVGYKKSDFKYNKEKDCFVCPAGQELYKIGKENILYRNSKACKKLSTHG